MARLNLLGIDPQARYDLREVCDHLGLSYGTVLGLARSSRLAGATKVGRKWFVPGVSILGYAEGTTGHLQDKLGSREGGQAAADPTKHRRDTSRAREGAMITTPKQRLCVALDVDALDEARAIATELSPHVGLFKVGAQLFVGAGPRAIEVVREAGGEVFLDLKFHDIPNTVARASALATRFGVRMFNVHASGGAEMMHSAVAAAHEEAARVGQVAPLVLAVTVLTSIDKRTLNTELRIPGELPTHVGHLAKLVLTAGLDGVVASAHEVATVKRACGSAFITVIPGIRPSWAATPDDQRRIMTPAAARAAGADYIVVGRPILGAQDRARAAEMIVAEMAATEPQSES